MSFLSLYSVQCLFLTNGPQKTSKVRPTNLSGGTKSFTRKTKQQASVTVAQASASDKVNFPKFVAGNLVTHMKSWRSIISDPSILEKVAGYFSEFDDKPFQPAVPHSSFSKGEEVIIAAEIKNC